MTVSVSTVHILVDDYDKALGFYRDALGLTVRNEVANGPFKWISLGAESQPDVQIVLSSPYAGRSQADGDAIAELLAKGEMRTIHLRSDDLEGVFEKIAAADSAAILQEPSDQPWGVRDGAVRDPAGNFIRIEQQTQ
ncbi:MAG: VOC family protein [Solirubrobacterales bacterium]|nr:VOC family protein [Solirubrobacterales bacterium]